ncbi:MAG: amidophosphoribosyltransferase [Elusimicrobia bacterium]|nr:amidophosphoribosyltransferase [Elusimicrobiota bacterium]
MRKEYCGIYGVWNSSAAAELTYLGLYALQHRGQESAGIVSCRKKNFCVRRGMGLVSDVFPEESLRALKGDSAIGHVRYSTTGSSSCDNIQPLVVDYQGKSIAVAHNGNIPSASRWRKKLESEGVIFATETDSELILKMIVKEKGSWEDRLKIVLDRLEGAFSLLVLFPGKLIAVRDSYGYRPLSMGVRGDSVFFSSESCAFDIIDAEYKRDLAPGEMVVLDASGEKILRLKEQPHQHCIFELIYFARPDSMVFNQSVYSARLSMGRQLAREKKIEADLVMPVPDSANMQALGYSQESGIPLEFGFMRNHYIGRTFIEPHQRIRDFRVKIKLTPIKEVLKDKRVIIIDDSIVRGTTSRKLVKSIRKAGAREVHLLISSPPIKNSCYYGIDTPTSEELIANRHSVDEIKEFLGVDSLYYLSIEGLLQACREADYCLACFNGDYRLKTCRKRKQPQ